MNVELIEFIKSFNLGVLFLYGRINEVKKSLCLMFSGTPCVYGLSR